MHRRYTGTELIYLITLIRRDEQQMHQDLSKLAEQVGRYLKSNNLKLAIAESCTGGWVSQAITSIPGSSNWFDRGFVTYSNAAKQEMLGVSANTIKQYGAVSEETALEMAQGAL